MMKIEKLLKELHAVNVKMDRAVERNKVKVYLELLKIKGKILADIDKERKLSAQCEHEKLELCAV
jgi:hypothetical protein